MHHVTLPPEQYRALWHRRAAVAAWWLGESRADQLLDAVAAQLKVTAHQLQHLPRAPLAESGLRPVARHFSIGHERFRLFLVQALGQELYDRCIRHKRSQRGRAHPPPLGRPAGMPRRHQNLEQALQILRDDAARKVRRMEDFTAEELAAIQARVEARAAAPRLREPRRFVMREPHRHAEEW